MQERALPAARSAGAEAQRRRGRREQDVHAGDARRDEPHGNAQQGHPHRRERISLPHTHFPFED